MVDKPPQFANMQEVDFHLMAGILPAYKYECPTRECRATLYSFAPVLRLQCISCNLVLRASDFR